MTSLKGGARAGWTRGPWLRCFSAPSGSPAFPVGRPCRLQDQVQVFQTSPAKRGRICCSTPVDLKTGAELTKGENWGEIRPGKQVRICCCLGKQPGTGCEHLELSEYASGYLFIMYLEPEQIDARYWGKGSCECWTVQCAVLREETR